MKRILLLITLISVIILLISFNICYDSNPFSSLDQMRDDILKGVDIIKNNDNQIKFNSPYIVSFEDNASLSKIHSSIKDYNYEILSNSSEKVFLIDIDNIDLFKKNNNSIIKCIYKDSTYRFSVCNNSTDSIDERVLSAYNFESLSNYNNSSDIVIAVLDSGVNRNHIALQGANILPGFDSVSQSIGVSVDHVGHGTSVIGMLSAVKGNSTGVEGLLNYSTILPINVTDENGDISSSSFIRAIYYAADSGAKIINMSFCGTIYLEAEQDAINYAFEKGCILVAASGNLSQDDISNDKITYPSSYEHVISVSSTNEQGKLSDFSVFNKYVDIAAKGENIKIISGVTDKAAYFSEGTSFSAPYISALSSLILSNLDNGININSDEMAVLLRRNAICNSNVYCVDYLNTYLDRNIPIVCGIENNKTYFENVVITFNHGSAYLDGFLINSGTKVNYNGAHRLVIVSDDSLIQYNFTTDNIPLEYECPEGDVFYKDINISFSRGTATLNGEPYYSGKSINSSGEYVFILTGPYGNKVEKRFKLLLNEPLVIGIESGKEYSTEVVFKVIGNCKALLNDSEIELGKQVYCTKAGDYSLILYNENGEIIKSYNFSINKPSNASFDFGFEDYGVFIDDHNNNVYLYSSSIFGIRIYSNNDFLNIKRIISVEGQVEDIVSSDNVAFVITDNGVILLSKKDILSDNAVLYYFENISVDNIFFDKNETYFLIDDQLFLLDEIDFSLIHVYTFSEIYQNSFYFEANNSIVLYNDNSFSAEVISLNDYSSFKQTFLNKMNNILCDGEFLYSNGLVYDSNFVIHSSVNCDSPKLFIDGYLISENSIYSIEEYTLVGLLSKSLRDIIVSKDFYYIIDCNNNLELYPLLESLPKSLFTPKPLEDPVISGYSQNLLNTSIRFSEDFHITQLIFNNDKFFVIDKNSNVLYSLNEEFELNNRIYLKDVPSYMFVNNDELFIFFKTLKEVCIYSETDIHYLPIDYELSVDMCVGKDDLFILSDGIVYKIVDNFSSEIFIDREDIISIGYSDVVDCIFASTIEGKLLKFDLNGSLIDEIVAASTYRELICDGNYISVGNLLIDVFTMTIVKEFEANINNLNGEYVFLSNGVYNLSSDILTNFSSSSELTIYDNSNIFTLINNCEIIKYNNPFECSIGELPQINIEGIKDNTGSFIGDVKISFEFGYGYIDGYPISSGTVIEEGGEHNLIVILPYAQSINYSFIIDTSIKSIEIVGPKELKVNDSIQYFGKFYPTGAKEEELVFSSTSDCIIIDRNGNIIATKEGKADIMCSTVDGRVSSVLSIDIKPFELIIANSRFKIDSTNSYLLGIPCYMRSSELLRFIKYNSGNARIIDKHNNIVSSYSYLSSGMWLEILNPRNEVILKYQIVLNGDIDGDGYVLPEDFLLLGKHIYKTGTLNGYQLEAADVTSDGKVNVSDLLRVSAHLLNKNRLYNNKDVYSIDDNNYFSFYDSQTPVIGDNFQSVLYFSKSDVQVIKGKIRFDKSKLSFISLSSSSSDYKVEFIENNDYIEFLVYNEKFKTGNDPDGFYLNLDLKVSDSCKANEQTYIELFDVVSEDGLSKNTFSNLIIKDNRDSTLLFSLLLNNGDIPLNFKKSTLKYNVIVPYNISNIDIKYIPFDETAKVEIDNPKLEVGINIISIKISKQDYETIYEIFVMRKSEDALSSESRAKNISTNVGVISPVFSSDNYEYSITLDRDTDINFCVDLLNNNSSYSILKNDFGYTIVCTAENGETTEYYFEKIVLYDFSTTVTPKPNNEFSLFIIILSSIAIAGIITTIILINRNRKAQ